MKKLFLLISIFCIILSSCKKEEEVLLIKADPLKIESISTPETTKSLIIGESFEMKIIISPENAENKNISFSSSDEKIASVDTKGNIQAIKEGSSTITATSEDGAKTSTCNIIVRSSFIHVTHVYLNEVKLKMEPTNEFQLIATVLPTKATNIKVNWYSSNLEVATVDGNGKLIAKTIGETTIVVTSEDGAKYAECIVKVVATPDPTLCVDKAGKSYRTIQIGDQMWMAENLAYLPVVGKPSDKGGYYVYDYLGYDIDEARATENYKKHGVLYSYAQAKASCPKGWHIASDQEWKTLEKYIGMNDYEINEAYGANRGTISGKLKAKTGWTMYGGINGTDDYGLTLVASGALSGTDFAALGWGVWLFTSTEIIGKTETLIVMRNFKSDIKGIMRYEGNSETSVGTVRCIKD